MVKVAIQSVTGCAGCQLTFYYIEEFLQFLSKIELVAAPMLKEKNYDGMVDVCFVEGSVTFKDDIKKLKKWRENSKVLVALGACACDGCIQQMKNFMNSKKVEKYVYGSKTKHLKSVKPVPISEYIKVDYFIKGCPVDKEEVKWFLKQFLAGKSPTHYEKSVCHECKLRENYCLLEQQRECYGPITFGECSIMCPDFNHPCTGCRGPIADGAFNEQIKLLVEKGFDKKIILQKMTKYAGLRIEELMKTDRIDLEKRRKIIGVLRIAKRFFTVPNDKNKP